MGTEAAPLGSSAAEGAAIVARFNEFVSTNRLPNNANPHPHPPPRLSLFSVFVALTSLQLLIALQFMIYAQTPRNTVVRSRVHTEATGEGRLPLPATALGWRPTATISGFPAGREEGGARMGASW